VWSTLIEALRSVRRAPGLACAAVLCLGLGASATTAVATLVSAVLLRPAPFPDADRLVRVWFRDPAAGARISLSIPDIADFANVKAFDAFAGTARVRATLRLTQGAERLRGEGVSPGYFALVGVRPALGRLLDAEDHAAGGPRSLVLSHGAWLRLFGGDPSVVGRTVHTERASYTVIGVTQRGFQGTVEDDVVEFFIALEHYEPQALITSRTSRPAWVIGRLAPGATLATAQQESERVLAGLASTWPDIYGRWQVVTEPLGENWRGRLRPAGGMLFAAAALVLVIAGANVGCLLLARVLDRRRELAVRAVLGASRRRILAQLAMEALILVIAGGAIGVLIGPSLLQALLAMSPLGRLSLPAYVHMEPDLLTLTLAFGVLACSAVIAGSVPVWLARRVDVEASLRDEGRGTLGSPAARRWSAVLIAAESGLTLIVLVTGGLLMRSYAGLTTLDLGFDRSRIARLAVTLSPSDVGDADRLPIVYERLRARLIAVPGVERIGLVHPTLPPWEGARTRVVLEGVDAPQAPDGLIAGAHRIDPGVLPMLGARLVAGRHIEPRDASREPAGVVISQSIARAFGGAERSIGRTLRLPRAGAALAARPLEIVGVVEDIAYDGLVDEETRRFVGSSGGGLARHDVYVALDRFPDAVVSIGASTTGDPAALLDPLRRAIAEVAPLSATQWISTMADEVALEYEPSRFYVLVAGAFSVSALVLTSVGLFALLSHAVARRAPEMGLRLALGASSASTVWLLVRGALWPVVAGLGIGALALPPLGALMQTLIFRIGAFDVLTIASAVATLVIVALAASAGPARRIAAIDPARAMQIN
jgi:putative ABC transport system permease protein